MCFCDTPTWEELYRVCVRMWLKRPQQAKLRDINLADAMSFPYLPMSTSSSKTFRRHSSPWKVKVILILILILVHRKNIRNSDLLAVNTSFIVVFSPLTYLSIIFVQYEYFNFLLQFEIARRKSFWIFVHDSETLLRVHHEVDDKVTWFGRCQNGGCQQLLRAGGVSSFCCCLLQRTDKKCHISIGNMAWNG